MLKRLFLCFLLAGFAFMPLHSQTIDELKAERAEKQVQISALQGEVAGLTKKIETFPGWKFGSLGTLGLNFSQFNNWISTKTPNTFASTFGFSGSGFANFDHEKFFWRNSGAINIAKTKLDTNTDDNVDAAYETSADAFGLNSLYGQKLSPKLAISALGEYRTTLLSNFNSPGYLDIGTGGHLDSNGKYSSGISSIELQYCLFG